MRIFIRDCRHLARAAFMLALLVVGAGQASAQAPAFTSAASVQFQIGVPKNFLITTTGSPAAVITRQGNIPPGVTFTDHGNGTATLGGIAENGTQGGASITLTATNTLGTATQSLAISVVKAAAVVSPNYATFVVGSEGSFMIYSDAEPYGTVSVSGTLPPGLSLSADNGFGMISLRGTPSPLSARTYPLTVVATNALGTDTQTLTVTVLPAIPDETVRNYSGMYYNTRSSGYAVNITHQGNVLVAAWYTFDRQERPVWFTAVTLRQGDGSFKGGYTIYTGTPFDLINNAPSALTNAAAGSVEMRFAPDGKLDFRFTPLDVDFPYEQRRTLTKLTFAAVPPVCRFTSLSRNAASNYTDLWYLRSESGWGMSIEHQGDLIYVAWYTYAADGQPMWLTSLLSLQPDGSYTGAINRPNAGGFYVYDFNGPVTTFPLPEVGTATLRFTDGEHGSFSYVVGSVNQTKQIERIVFASPAQVCSVTPAN
jgi:hypothetical protein